MTTTMTDQPAETVQNTEDATETEQTTEQAPATEQEKDTQQTDPAEDLAKVTAERDALAVQVLRLTVAAETGVPADLLTADTDEALRAQAAKLTEYAQARRRPAPDPSQGARGDSPVSTDPIGDRIRRR